MVWLVCVIAFFIVVGLATGGVTLLLGRRLVKEFTRPGVTVEQGTPQWGGWTFPDAAGEPARELQRSVTFQSADGVLLRGEFWAQARVAPTIILSHGFHLPSAHFRSVAALEYAHGANILLFDYRGHGESAWMATTCGNAEVNDLVAAVEVAAGQAETRRGQVYIHGFSMGAAVALLLPSHPAIAGIIADSAYARLDEMIRMLIMQVLDEETGGWRGPTRVVRFFLPLLTRLTLLGGRILFRLRYHAPLIARPDQVIGRSVVKQTGRLPGTLAPPILLIHAEQDPLIAIHHAHRLVGLAHAAGRAIRVYYTPCAIHCGSYGHDPQQYMALIQAFATLKNQSGRSSDAHLQTESC
ncbi:MAG TPA: alpha/beta fold hydrolase [Ktedonobacteraceae bacterium]|nr:alpha/beta fold hydrolase [Ktedonobacteraceae bacterium]